MKGLIFTYLLVYGGAAAALVSPFWGLMAYVCVSLIKPHSLWFWSVPVANYSRTVGVALIIGWILSSCGTWKVGRGKPVVLCLIGYWLWCVLCAVTAVDQEEAWKWVEYLAKIVLPFLIGVTVLDSVWKLKALAWMIVLSHGYLAFEFNLSYFAGHNRLFNEGFGGMDNNCMVIGLVACIGMALILALETRSLLLRGLAFGSMAFMGHAVLFSFSRGGMLATGVVGAAAFFIIRKTAKHYLLFALAAAGAIYLAGPQVRERFLAAFVRNEARDSSAQSRIGLWRDCIDCFAKHPVVGVGPRSWPKVAEERYGWTGEVKEAHTLWLQTAAQIGLPGFLLLFGFYGLCILKLWPLRGEPAFDPWLNVCARAVIVALVGFMFAAQFVSIEPLELPFYITLLGVGVLRAASFPPGAAATPSPPGAEEEASPASPPPVRFPARPRFDPTVRFRNPAVVDLGESPGPPPQR